MSTLTAETQAWLDRLILDRGSHSPDGKACVMEAVAYVAREKWSDNPKCASPIIGSFLRSWNDAMNDEDRQMLKPYILRLVNTNTGPQDEATRTWMLTDWLVRECAPAWLRLACLTAQAELLERLAPLVDTASARAAQGELTAARDAARAAARDAAGDAAWDAAWDAAGTAARTAAWAAAGDAARDAARAAARDAAWDAARAAARDALAPTVKVLQVSALGLLDRMIDVGR